MKLMQCSFSLLAAALTLCSCAQPQDLAQCESETLILSTTTSTEDSGLLSFMLPFFEEEYGLEVRVISVGTGAALQLGRDGEADVLLVHARTEEDRFVEEGYAERRYDVMYNDFVIVGPDNGTIVHNNDIYETLITIWSENLPFVSRGDDSGTHTREISLWEALEISPQENSAYYSVGQGMGATLGMAVELQAFTLSDRATWLSFPNKDNFTIISEGHPDLLNPYGIMAVSSSKNPAAAGSFINWITSPKAQELIASFGIEEFGEPLFFPNAAY